MSVSEFNRSIGSNLGAREFFVDRVNKVRAERGLNIRDQYAGEQRFDEVRILFEPTSAIRRFFGLQEAATYSFKHTIKGESRP